MINLTSEIIQDKYKSIIADKENGIFKDTINKFLQSEAINSEWQQIIKSKQTIKVEADYLKFCKDLEDFFKKLYEEVSAPGANAFITWMEDLGVKNDKNLKKFREHIIDNYSEADYTNNIEIILNHKSVLQYGVEPKKVFNNLIKKENEEILRDANNLIRDANNFSTTSTPFLEKTASRITELNDIEELTYTEIEELFSQQQTDGNIIFYEDLINEAIVYINDVEEKKYGNDASTLSIKERVQDLVDFIEELNSLDLSSKKDTSITKLFKKCNGSIVPKKGKLMDSLTEFVSKTWDDLIDNYSSIKEFHDRKDLNKNYLDSNKEKWQIGDHTTDLKFVIEKFSDLRLSNPIDKIDSLAATKVSSEIDSKAKEIVELDTKSDALRIKILDLLKNKVSDFETSKKTIIDKLLLSAPVIKTDVHKLYQNLQGLKMVDSDNYKNKYFFDFLSNDFDAYYEIYTDVDVVYEKILSESGMKESIDWLKSKLENDAEFEVTTDDFAEVEKMKELLSKNLISITINKNS